ncbi:MAG: creatininase family protein [Armatimonadota bacterium]
MLDWQATWRDLATPPWLAILPLGSVEQHGPCLPIGTDWVVADYLGKGVAKELDAWLLPAQPFSCAQEHQDFPGTISLRPATLAALLTDIVESLGRMGVPRLAILNYHGGNWQIKPTLRDLNRQQQSVTVYLFNAYEGTPGLDLSTDMHAGAFETSQMLHLFPHLVRKVDCDTVPDVPRETLDQVGMRAVNPQGNWGCPSQGTAERGARDLAWMIQHSAQRIRDAIRTVEQLREQEEA